VLLYCDEFDLIGREMFSIDGRYQAKIADLLSKHRKQDAAKEREAYPGMSAREEKALEALQEKTAKLERWLRENPDDKPGARGSAVKSSMTDADSAKMVSSHGVVQGYNAQAVVDSKHQIIVAAEAFGRIRTSSERRS
jgi:hypothetical protein